MNIATPRITSAQEALILALGQVNDLSDVLCVHGIDPGQMVAILVDGDWTSACEGATEMSELFSDFLDLEFADKMLCAIVVTGNLVAPKAILIDRDSDWSPSLIVGGNLTAKSLCLGGGQSKIMGDLHLLNTLYGHYNHGELQVHGAITAKLILSNDFSMEFYAAVECKNILSSCGSMNIDAHYEDDTLDRALKPDLLDSNNNPIDAMIMRALISNQSLLLSPGKIGKAPKRATLSKAGRERLAAYETATQPVLNADFSNCDMKFVPEGIAQFTKIKSLNLENNRFASLPDCLADLNELEVLTITSCGLTSLPDWLGRLPNLRVLRARDNDLVSIPSFEGAFGALEELQIGNPFSDSNEHKQWACTLPLGRFLQLRSFSNFLSSRGTFTSSSDFNAWFSPTLEHLRMTPEIAGVIPACLGKMQQLKSLDLQIKTDIEASALSVLSQLTALEVIQFSNGEINDYFLRELATALPNTLIRCSSVIIKKELAVEVVNDALPQETRPDISSLIYQNKLNEALACVEQEILESEKLSPWERSNRLLEKKLDILSSIAGNATDLSLKRECIKVAADWASIVLTRYQRLSIPTIWQLGFEFGNLRINCCITQAWSLIRRESPDYLKATEILNQAESELSIYGIHSHLTVPLKREIIKLRELIAV